ncbi:PIF1-like helicase-domain-containing protein, partial [Fomes fomentarius]
SKLNAEQYGIYTEIMDAVTNRKPLCAFVDGKAGRGKTFLVNTICNKLRSEGHIVLPTATSAFAAQLYPGGKTTHSVFKVRPYCCTLHGTPNLFSSSGPNRR